MATATRENETATVAGVVRVERVLPHPPRRVWRALTRPEAIRHWLLPVADGDTEKPLETPGTALGLRAAPGTRISYEVADAEPERRLSLWWRVSTAREERTADADAAVATRVTWTLVPEQDGTATRLVIEHTTTASAAPLSGAVARVSAYLELGRVFCGSRRERRRISIGRAASAPCLTVGRIHTRRERTLSCR